MDGGLGRDLLFSFFIVFAGEGQGALEAGEGEAGWGGGGLLLPSLSAAAVCVQLQHHCLFNANMAS